MTESNRARRATAAMVFFFAGQFEYTKQGIAYVDEPIIFTTSPYINAVIGENAPAMMLQYVQKNIKYHGPKFAVVGAFHLRKGKYIDTPEGKRITYSVHAMTGPSVSNPRHLALKKPEFTKVKFYSDGFTDF
jgi:hypothetical protein